VAPGVSVYGAKYDPSQPDRLREYDYEDGTSCSAPFVAGTVALMISYKPNLTTDQIMDLIRFTADDINKDTHPGVDIFAGYGRLSVGRILAPFELE
jgi:subtilisin family serine protease